MKKCVLISILIFPVLLFAQYYDQFDCPVIKNGESMKYPFTGGFDAPQFTNVDIDGDGLLDLYVFDRNGHASSFFIRNTENSPYPFSFDKTYNKYLPKDMEGFCTMADFNDDNIPDIFTSAVSRGAAGVVLYQASRTNGEYDYTVRRMGRPAGNPDILWNNFPSGQVYSATTDIPAIVDVDRDGDLDILTFDEAGSYVYFCLNNQVEKSLPKDTMDFLIADYCFGKFLESGLSQTIQLSNNPLLCANGIKEEEDDFDDKSGGVHSGSTILAFDPDLDSDYDLLLGDLTYDGLVFLENGGSSNAAHMTALDLTFPNYDTHVQMPIFLAAFSVDVDNDGLNDVLVAPNGQSSIQNVDNIWYYKNTGDTSMPFALMQKKYLTEETLDYGSFSVPALVDYNSDGLMDIVIGVGGAFDGIQSNMHLVLLENTGTTNSPSFEVVDEDYLNFSQFANTSSNPAPCFGDIDNDGDQDLIIGDEAGKLYFFRNKAGEGQTLDFENPVYNWMDISAGQRIRPQLFDYNQDGLLDLIIGERNTNGINDPVTNEFVLGNLNYYQNQGTVDEAVFDSDVNASPNFPALGQILVSFSESASARGGATPHFYSVNDKIFALVGSVSGRLSLYEVSSTSPSDKAILLDDRVGGLVEGFYCAPAIHDFNSDGVFELMLGNSRGGLSFFETDLMTSNSSVVAQTDDFNLRIFPNPSQNIVQVNIESGRIKKMIISDMNGRIIKSLEGKNHFDVQDMSPGMYILNLVTSDNKNLIEKFLVVE